MGVHQSAQCDRASLAQNYYYGGMKFLYPEVNENRCIDGIVSCELPLSSYLAACLYKLFGYSEFWFRLLSYLFFFAGMMALWFLLKTRMHLLTATALVLFVQASPILLFYGPGFLPDTVSLGLALLSWALFFGLHIRHPWLPSLTSIYWRVLFILALGLSVAVKTTSLLQWLSMAGLAVAAYLPFMKIALIDRKKLLVSLLWALLIPFVWYMWSRHLAATHNSQYFMMRVPLSETWQSYSDAWAVYLANWPPQVFADPLIYITVSLLLLVLFLKPFISKELWLLTCLNSAGSISFLFLMIEQFKYHDYYAICLIPAFFLNWLALADATNRLPKKFWYIKILLFIGICSALNMQFYSGRKNLDERYTEGNYWEQSHHRSTDLDTFRRSLDSLGIDRNDCVMAGFDPSPNNILYLLHLRGHRISKEHEEERLRYILFGAHPQWLISNDSMLDKRIKALVPAKTVKQFKYLRLLKIDYSDSLSK
jgi:hypothetical protein